MKVRLLLVSRGTSKIVLACVLVFGASPIAVFLGYGGILDVELLKEEFPTLRLLLWVCAIGYGCFRVFSTHPVSKGGYGEYWATLPWEARNPMPAGPIHLVWQDGLALVIFMAFTFFESWALILVLMMCSYIATLGLTFYTTGPRWLGYATHLSVIAIVSIYHHSTVLALMLLGLATIASQVALQHSLVLLSRREFAEWNAVAKNRRLQVSAMNALPWPNRAQPMEREGETKTTTDKVGGSLLISSLLFAFLNLLPLYGIELLEGEDGIFYFLYALFAGVMILARVCMFVFSHAAPIGIFGRIATGRIIIPRYDIIFVTPLIASAFFFLAPELLSFLNDDPRFIYPLSLLIVSLTLCFCGPNLKDWDLVGAYRLRKI